MLREVAGRRGVGMTEALRQVLAEELEREPRGQRGGAEARYEAVMAIAAAGRGDARHQRHDRRRDPRLRRGRDSVAVIVEFLRAGGGAAPRAGVRAAGRRHARRRGGAGSGALLSGGRDGDRRPQGAGQPAGDRRAARPRSGRGWCRSRTTTPALAADAFLRYGKGRHPAGLNFGDCMAYAVAKAEGAPLLFTGGDFARTDVAVAGEGG